MCAIASYPRVEVAAALIRRGDRILMVYNENWKALTLPITKRRQWVNPDNQNDMHDEDWADAAGRAAWEVLNKTVRFDSMPLHEIVDLEYGGRTGEWKRYHLKIFDAGIDSNDTIVDGLLVEWLGAEDILDEHRRPISPTAREVIRQLRANKKL